jgi:glycosyltransferase involved in cell wall biosynthesis/SAM-dependent methyltransferase
MLADLSRRESTFDVVHIHGLYRFHALAAAAVARARGVPYVIQAHGSLDPWHRQKKRHAKDLYHALVQDPIIRGAASVACTSRREQASIRDLGYAVPTWVIPIGTNADELRTPEVPDFAAATDIGVDAQVITFLGRISEKKGVPLLVDAFRIAASAFPRAHLLIAGPDDEGIGRGLAPMIAEAGLAGRISFLGVVGGAQKRALLQRSDVFVLPSADESFAIAVVEAMAVGCPVVISPEVAIEGVVRASGAGLVVGRDPSAIASAIGTILTGPALAAAMGAAGRIAVDQQFSWPTVATQMEAMYEAVVNTTLRRSGLGMGATWPSTENSATWAPTYACPQCRGPLKTSGAGSSCESCAWTGAIVAGVPILALDPAVAEHEETDHHPAHGHKSAQAAHFDRPEEEAFETDRPHGTPRLYRFLLAEKLRRAMGPIRPHLIGASALSVCGGSGMDAEFLARAGAIVTTSDLSLGAAIRAKARSERHGLDIRSIVADVEHLPFADQSFDLVAVHDGLHHLEDPYSGLAEMARVARRWVVVTEPARASVTQLAVRLGLALETEAAGNRVARVEPAEVAAFLEARGYLVIGAERYAMYYPHHPGVVFSLLSRPIVFTFVRAASRLANALLGRFGNKMVMVAERSDRQPNEFVETVVGSAS